MFINLFLVGYRNLLKNKRFTFINVLGLSISLTCFAFIAAWVQDELSYDRFHEKVDRIVRVALVQSTDVGKISTAQTSASLAKALNENFPHIQNTVRIDKKDAIVKHGEKLFSEDRILMADNSFFDVFSFHLTMGDEKTALTEPYSIVLTESMAKKYFPDESPLSKTLNVSLYDSTEKGAFYTVTGVIADPPDNSHIQFKFLASFKTIEVAVPETSTEPFWNNEYYTYLLLQNKEDIQHLKNNLAGFANIHSDERIEGSLEFQLQSLQSIHLHSGLRDELEPTGKIENVFIFSSIAIFILLLAAINYINLTTARSIEIAKEISVRKVMGASKKLLIFQYQVEALIVTLLSLCCAYFLFYLFKAPVEQLIGKNLFIFESAELPILLFVIAILLGLLAGVFPAVYASAYNPATVLKGRFSRSAKGVWLHKSLVVFQFTVSIVLIVGILVVQSQVIYIQNKNLGYNKDAILALKVNGSTEVIEGIQPFKNAVLTNSTVSQISKSNTLLGNGLDNETITTINGDGSPASMDVFTMRADEKFFDAYQIELAAGKAFSGNNSFDSGAIIINESAVKALGWGSAENALEKFVKTADRTGRVIGVVKDFHFNSLRYNIRPVIISPVNQGERFSQISIKIDAEDPAKAIGFIESQWKKFFPTSLFDYRFLDDRLAEQYYAEDRFAGYFFYFSILSLIIACLGLYGLTVLSINQRVKEIGIRKILGASVKSIVTILSKDFMLLVVIAAVIALPIAWWSMNHWLQGFAYRVQIQWWMFIIAALIAIFLAMLTVVFYSMKAAVANPAKHLKVT